MPPRVGLAVCLSAFVVACGSEDSASPAWNHNSADTTLGPTAWAEIDASFEQCADGVEQSPVDIAGATPADLPKLELETEATPIVVENTGHTIEAVMPDDGGQTLTIDATEYRLLQYHFHAPSEHTLEGRAFPAEVHFVYQSDDGEVAVVGVFLVDVGQGFFDAVVESAPNEAGEEAEVENALNPLMLLGGDTVADYFTYPGSLTTPGCTEGVRWILLPEPFGISPDAVARLHELISEFPEYDGYENNNRPTQRLNERVIERATG